MNYRLMPLLLLGLTLLSSTVVPAEEQAAAKQKAPEVVEDLMEMSYQKSMKTDEAMPTGMARPGMKKGDVKAKAEEKEAEMKRMMQEEMKRPALGK